MVLVSKDIATQICNREQLLTGRSNAESEHARTQTAADVNCSVDECACTAASSTISPVHKAYQTKPHGSAKRKLCKTMSSSSAALAKNPGNNNRSSKRSRVVHWRVPENCQVYIAAGHSIGFENTAVEPEEADVAAVVEKRQATTLPPTPQHADLGLITHTKAVVTAAEPAAVTTAVAASAAATTANATAPVASCESGPGSGAAGKAGGGSNEWQSLVTATYDAAARQGSDGNEKQEEAAANVAVARTSRGNKSVMYNFKWTETGEEAAVGAVAVAALADLANLPAYHKLLASPQPKPIPKSGYYGVVSSGRKWQAQITCAGKLYNLGGFSTKEEAAAAYDAAARQHRVNKSCVYNFDSAETGEAAAASSFVRNTPR